MTTWAEDILQQLQLRDDFEKKDSLYFKAFAQLLQQIRADGDSPPPSLTIEGDKQTALLLQDNQQLKRENEQLIEILNQSTIKSEIRNLDIQKHLKTISTLEKSNDKLSRRLNNITQELQEKNKSIEIINDETLMSQIQVNVLTDKVSQLTVENETLIKRWLQKMKNEADNLNNENAFHGSVSLSSPSTQNGESIPGRGRGHTPV